MILRALLSITLIWPFAIAAKGVYQTPDDFVKQTLGDQAETKVIWLDASLRNHIETILQHDYNGHRIRYWRDNQRTLWILEEIGKTKPITTGIVISNHQIQTIKVLVFRESRGWEVKHAFFTNQFKQASLTDENRLDRHIDGISGATLSVRALTKLARIALLLDSHLSS